MTRTVGERWEEYLRLGRRMSPHTIAAYRADLRSLMEFLALEEDTSPESLRETFAPGSLRRLRRGVRDRRLRATPQRSATLLRGRCGKGFCPVIRLPCCRHRVPISACLPRSTNRTRGCSSIPLATKP